MANNLSIFIGAVLYPACGQWVDLPMDEDELTEIIENVKREADCEEVMISDFEGDWNISEYDNIFDLNEKAELLDDLSEYERELVQTIIHEHGDSLEEAVDRVQEGNYRIYSNCYSMSDVAREYLEEVGDLDLIPEFLRDYFDFEAYGEMLDNNGYFYDLGDSFLEIWN